MIPRRGDCAADATACSLWWADVRTIRAAALGRFLSAAEQNRRQHYRRREDADRFALGAVLLRAVAGAATGLAPELVAIDRTCANCSAQHGRPRIGEGRPHVSVAHSGSVVLIACCGQAPVGVDVEVLRPVDLAALGALTTSPHERSPRDAEGLFVRWTRKEAFLKATGDGIGEGMAAVTVSDPALPAAVLEHRGARVTATLTDVALPVPGHVAALAVLAAGPIRLNVRAGTELL